MLQIVYIKLQKQHSSLKSDTKHVPLHGTVEIWTFVTGYRSSSFASGHHGSVLHALFKPGSDSTILHCGSDGRVTPFMTLDLLNSSLLWLSSWPYLCPFSTLWKPNTIGQALTWTVKAFTNEKQSVWAMHCWDSPCLYCWVSLLIQICLDLVSEVSAWSSLSTKNKIFPEFVGQVLKDLSAPDEWSEIHIGWVLIGGHQELLQK